MKLIDKIPPYFKSNQFLRNLALAFTITVVFLFLVFQFLSIYTGHGRNRAVPDLRGMTLDEAEVVLKKKKLRFVVFDSVYNTEYKRGTVVDHHPAPFFYVKKKRKIFLTMNAVNPEKIAMPNLVGITLREARAKMDNYGLRVGELIYIYDIAKNVVLEQKYNGVKVNEGDSVIKGSFIDLVLGKGLSNVTTMVPNLLGLSIEEAKVKASDSYFSLGHVSYDSTVLNTIDSLDARIFMQEPKHSPDVLVPLGTSIYIWVTADSTKLLNVYEFETDLEESPYSDE